MCKWGDTVVLQNKDPKATRKSFNVDRCIAPMVKALNDAGIYTLASCCGHGKLAGSIILVGGQELIIAPNYEYARRVFDLMVKDGLCKPCITE